MVIETDLTGLAQGTTPRGLVAGLCNLTLPEGEVAQIVQPDILILRPRLRFRAA